MTSSFWVPQHTVSAPSYPGVKRPTRRESIAREEIAQQNRSITFTYRGQSYQSSAYVMEGVELQTEAVYRGVSHRLDTFSANPSSDRPKRTLCYRGVPYQQ